jgi:cephalosporin hydroxylase
MLTIDDRAGRLTVEEGGEKTVYALDSPEAFAILSDAWLRAGWRVKHVYTFSWLGRPVIQLPEDMLRMQELICRVRPDVIVETGVAHGGSLVFYAGVCRLLGRGRVIGVDIEIRSHNRAAIEAHPLSGHIELIEGDSADPSVVADVSSRIEPGETVMVVLDSDHAEAHVLAELEAYGPLVSPGSYIVAMDGHIMELAAGLPRTSPDWRSSNPKTAAAKFVEHDPAFVVEEPEFLFNESQIARPVSYSSGGVIKRIR